MKMYKYEKPQVIHLMILFIIELFVDVSVFYIRVFKCDVASCEFHLNQFLFVK